MGLMKLTEGLKFKETLQKLTESLKLVFQTTLSLSLVTVSFHTPLWNPLAVSAKAWTQGQLIRS